MKNKTQPRSIATVFTCLFMLIILFFCTPVLAQDNPVPGAGSWISILPPLVAILFALTLRQVIPALFAGVWLGAWAINGFSLTGLWLGLLDSFQVHILTAFADPDRGAIILFSLMIGGTVGIISRNGGMQGIVQPDCHLGRYGQARVPGNRSHGACHIL